MKRREALGALGVGAAAVGLGTAHAAAQQQAQEHAQHEGHHEHAEIMSRCARLCDLTARHCLDQLRKGEGDREYHATTHELAVGCKMFCDLSGTLMTRGNPLAALAHEANAESCRICAEACDKSDAPIMKQCAEACRACAKACQEAAKAGGHDHHHAAAPAR